MDRNHVQSVGEGYLNGQDIVSRLLGEKPDILEGTMHILLEDIAHEPLALRAHATLSMLMSSPLLLQRLQEIPECRTINRSVEQLADYLAGLSHTPPLGVDGFQALLTMVSQAIHAVCAYTDFRKIDDPDDIARSIVTLITVLTENGYVNSAQCLLLEDCLYLIEINFDADTSE